LERNNARAIDCVRDLDTRLDRFYILSTREAAIGDLPARNRQA